MGRILNVMPDPNAQGWAEEAQGPWSLILAHRLGESCPSLALLGTLPFLPVLPCLDAIYSTARGCTRVPVPASVLQLDCAPCAQQALVLPAGTNNLKGITHGFHPLPIESLHGCHSVLIQREPPRPQQHCAPQDSNLCLGFSLIHLL